MSLAYLAYPIDFGREEGSKPASVVALALAERGWTAYLPGDALLPAVTRTGPEINLVNRAVIRLSKMVVALWPGHVPSVGVPLDIEFAKSLDLPTWVVHDGWLDASWSAVHWNPKVKVEDWSEATLRNVVERIVP
jgi:hypothetical protein